MDSTGLQHLVRVIGLCQVPRDYWSEDDNLALRKAREYVQRRQLEGLNDQEARPLEGERSRAG